MKITASYDTLCELCDINGWRLELGREPTATPGMPSWWLQIENDGEVVGAEVRAAALSQTLNHLVALVIKELQRVGWLKLA